MIWIFFARDEQPSSRRGIFEYTLKDLGIFAKRGFSSLEVRESGSIAWVLE